MYYAMIYWPSGRLYHLMLLQPESFPNLSTVIPERVQEPWQHSSTSQACNYGRDVEK